VYVVSEAASNRTTATKAQPANGDGVYVWRFTTPAANTGNLRLIFRFQDTDNYVFFTNDGSTDAYAFKKRVAGIESSIPGASGAITWTTSTTYTVIIAVKGNQFQWWCPENSSNTSDWIADANNTLVGQTLKWGIGGATLAADAFTGTNGTRLYQHPPTTGPAWSESPGVTDGTWEIQSNRARYVTDGLHGNGLAWQPSVSPDVESQAEITMPGSFTTSWLSGVAFRVADAGNYGYVALLRNASQPSSDEVECHEVVGGVDRVVHKSNLGGAFVTSTTYTLKVQVRGDLVIAFVDGKPRCSYYLSPGFLAAQGAGVGLFSHASDEGSVFDNWLVRAL
jgi:hypothetical protein